MIATHPRARAEWRRRRAALFRRNFSPPPKLTLSEWADRYRHLSKENSAEPGPWRTSRVPWMREIMDACTDPRYHEVVVQKSAQIAGTEGLVNNLVGYHIDQDPAPILVVQPTIDEAHKYSKEKLAPMLRDTPRLRGRVRDPRSREANNTILAKEFPGGHLGIVGANAPTGLRARSRRVVIFDEVDGYPSSAGTEGDPIALGEKRMTGFWNWKSVKLSTPLLKDASRIALAYKLSDQREWYVPCPHCDHVQVLKWDHLKWEKTGDGESKEHHPETAAYMCAACGVLIDESDKPRMAAAGRWVAKHPGRPVAGFKLNALTSLFPRASWANLVREFLAAIGDAELMQVFRNTVLGETWDPIASGEVDPSSLLARREAYAAEVPAGVGILTMAVDVQPDRLEWKVKGYGAKQESWLIARGVLQGDPGIPWDTEGSLWTELDALRAKTYQHEDGARMRVMATSIDTGGHHSDAVYAYTAPRHAQRVYAIKGSSKANQPIWPDRASRSKKRSTKLYQVGTDTAKDAILLSRIKRKPPADGTPCPTAMHFPQGTSEEYFAQLTAESKVRAKLKDQRIVYRWKKRRERNEALDLEVYCLAGLYALGKRVYENLEVWVRRVQEDGRRRRAADEEATPAPVAVPVPDSAAAHPGSVPAAVRSAREAAGIGTAVRSSSTRKRGARRGRPGRGGGGWMRG